MSFDYDANDLLDGDDDDDDDFGCRGGDRAENDLIDADDIDSEIVPERVTEKTHPILEELLDPTSDWEEEEENVETQGWKFMSCSHCQELSNLLIWLLIGCSLLCSQSGASLLFDPTLDMTY